MEELFKRKKLEVKPQTRSFYQKKKIIVLGEFSDLHPYIYGFFSCLSVHDMIPDVEQIVCFDMNSLVIGLCLSFSRSIPFHEFMKRYTRELYPFPVFYPDDVDFRGFITQGLILPNLKKSDGTKEMLKYQELPLLIGMGRNDVTFREHYEYTGKIMIFPVNDLNSGKYNYLSVLTIPNVKILDATTSYGHPLYFASYKNKFYPLYQERFFSHRLISTPVETILKECSRFWVGHYITPAGREVIGNKEVAHYQLGNSIIMKFEFDIRSPLQYAINTFFPTYQIGKFQSPDTSNPGQIHIEIQNISEKITQDFLVPAMEKDIITLVSQYQVSELRTHYVGNVHVGRYVMNLIEKGYIDCENRIKNGYFDSTVV